jgi:eukaryotic-like serine/threonine-protein kinase
VPPSQLEPGIPPALEQVVMRALEKDPARRFADADEFIGALETARRVPPVRQITLEPTPGEPWEPYQEERGSRWWIWLLVVVVLAAAALGAYFLLAGKRVDVPNVVGKTTSQAADSLHQRGLEVSFVNAVSDRKRGTVISQDPEAGGSAKEGSTVTAKVSAGPGTAPVPEVEGLSENDAEDALNQAGFKPKIERQYSDTVAKGTVISANPPQGEEITKGRTVTLTVSKGKQGIAVPQLVGTTRDDAEGQLSDAGLTANVTEKESSKEAGTVLSQDPPAGTTVDKGATVNLVVAKARPEVPDVTTGNPAVADAQKKLEAAGYKVQTRDDPNAPPELAGRVTRQDPAAGEHRSSGATVTIFVGPAAAATPTPSPTPAATP